MSVRTVPSVIEGGQGKYDREARQIKVKETCLKGHPLCIPSPV